MNIFHLDVDPVLAAQSQCDKHVVRMPLEHAQMLCTAHRMLDGKPEQVEIGGKLRKLQLLPGEQVLVEDGKLKSTSPFYKATHVNHPSAVWCRTSTANYAWLFEHFQATSAEYQARYGRVHKSWELLGNVLRLPPQALEVGGLTDFVQAVPDDCKHSDPVEAYRLTYRRHKARFARWAHSSIPTWFHDESDLQRTN